MRKRICLAILCMVSVLACAFCLAACGEKHIHTFDKSIADSKYLKSGATCTSKAEYYLSCECGAKGSETFLYGDMLPHSYKQEVAANKYLKSGATCTSKAEYYLSCECGAKGSETFLYGDMLPHTKDDGVVLSESDCETQGEVHYHCKVCNADLGKSKLPLAPHKFVLEDNYWTLSGYEASNDTRSAVIPYSCSACKKNFTKVYNATDFAFAKNKIRIEDMYSTETALIFDSENKYLVINLASGDKALSTLKTEGLYDDATGVLTVPVRYKSVALNKVKVSGFKNPKNSFAISTQIGNNITVVLHNISYTAPKNTVAFNADNVNNVTLEIEGLVDISGASGMSGITARNLSINGTGTLTVAGGDGEGGSDNGGNGGDGIKASNLTLSCDGEVLAVGGNGGNARNRDYGDNGGEGHSGRDGYKGGDGGIGIDAAQIPITQGTLGVFGGRGGRGGDASESNRSEWVNTGSKDVVGGRGGDGGNGAVAVKTGKIKITGGALSATGGSGGDSGKAGGCHDGDYSGFVALWGNTTATNGARGTAGNGGVGITDCTKEGDESLITAMDGAKGTTTMGYNQNR